MPRMNQGLKTWTADEMAECLTISDALSAKLWRIVSEAETHTPLGGDGSPDRRGNPTVETPDGRLNETEDDKPRQFWKKLTEDEQDELNKAYAKYTEV